MTQDYNLTDVKNCNRVKVNRIYCALVLDLRQAVRRDVAGKSITFTTLSALPE